MDLQSTMHSLQGAASSLHSGQHASQTLYMAMSIQANQVPVIFDICASFSSWLTLAGFIVLPATFTSLKNSNDLGSVAGGKEIQDAVRNLGLLPVAAILCCVGIASSSWLWWRWHKNYIWLVSRIFLPGLFHSLIGLFTTLANIFSAQGGHMSVTAKVTISVTTVCGGCMLILVGVYSQLVNSLITETDRKVSRDGKPQIF
ncbi:hypothetical protein E8E12_000346 [Didymella heteroderae]|uniref:Uncharacterized protein n=1 Tax=Didymella heteroderae TaxID=1769908 RepID=A0A9P4WG04_9PLEO|nr:hypothetical protein E8E12_000346 [Didymella heteroderae]